MKKLDIKSMRCPVCNSSQTYVRRTKEELVCQKGGHITPLKDIKK